MHEGKIRFFKKKLLEVNYEECIKLITSVELPDPEDSIISHMFKKIICAQNV